MTRARLWRAGLAWLAVAAVLTVATVLAARRGGPDGLLLTTEAGTLRVSSVDLRDLRLDPRLAGAKQATWEGFWLVDRPGRYDLVAQGGGPIVVMVDGRPVVDGHREGRQHGQADLAAGPHALWLRYERPDGPDVLRLRWSEAGRPPRELARGTLFAETPTAAQQAWSRAASWLRLLAQAAWALPLVALAALAALGRCPERLRRALRVALPAMVVLYAAALRFDALVGRYAWEGPPWAIRAQRVVEGWRPSGLRWDPSAEITGGDPFHYVERARAMRGFYEADAREPLFPALTRVLLKAMDDRMLAVHVASALCSTLAVLATYFLGAAAFSRAVGLGGALALAVERDALWWSVEGFRDDAFMLFVVLSALCLVRLLRRPTTLAAVVAGLAGAAACLTRITSLSFLLPALAVLLVVPRDAAARDRRHAVAVAGLVLLMAVGPFLISCALAYGDPFYAVNLHTKFYRSRSGLGFQESMSWVDYLRTGSTLGHQVATGFTGLTTYPFTNKWHGLDYVSPWLARVLEAASLAGLVLFLRSAQGRLLLLVLFASLLPYAFTWPIAGGAEWRFTEAAYPFYLIAAALALTRAARWGLDLRARRSASAAAG
jgi:hypothetical protein